MKYYQKNNNSTILQNNVRESIVEDITNSAVRNRFIRQVAKKSSSRITGVNLINNIINQKLNEESKKELYGTFCNDMTPRSTVLEEYQNSRSKMKKSEIESMHTYSQDKIESNNEETPIMFKLINENNDKKNSLIGIIMEENNSDNTSNIEVIEEPDLNKNFNQNNHKNLNFPSQKQTILSSNTGNIPVEKKSSNNFTNYVKSIKLNTNIHFQVKNKLNFRITKNYIQDR